MKTTREQILECACRLYLSDGFEGFSMRKLARDVGVSAPALYKYYGSKEDVLAAVVAEGYRQFSQHLYRALEGRTPGERLAMAAEGYLHYALAHSSFYEAMYTAPEMIGMERLPEEITLGRPCAGVHGRGPAEGGRRHGRVDDDVGTRPWTRHHLPSGTPASE